MRIANEVAARGRTRSSPGNICNTWSYDSDRPGRSGAVVRAQYEEQLGWAVEEGIDFVIAETYDHVGEALIGLDVCQELGLPAHGDVRERAARRRRSTATTTSTPAGSLADAGAAIVGLNCSRGPATMLPLLERIRAAVDVPVAAQPVPVPHDAASPAFESLESEDGRRMFPIELESFQCTRFEMADFARRARDIGVDYIGICCGGGPHHVRAMAEALGRDTPASRYSPAIELHPVLGAAPGEDGEPIMRGWSAGD